MINETSNTVSHTLATDQRSEPVDVAIDPSAHTVWVANSLAYTVPAFDEISNKLTHTVDTGAFAGGVAVDAGTHTVYVTNPQTDNVSVIDAATDTVTHVIHLSHSPSTPEADPTAVVIDPGTHTAYVANSVDDTVSVIDEASNTVTHTISVGQGPSAVDIDPATHTVYTANYYDNTVSVIDTITNTEVASVDVGGEPLGLDGLAVDPGTHALYVANSGDDTVSVISPTSSPLQYQPITFTSTPPAQPMVGGSYLISANGGGSGNPVTFTPDAYTAPQTCTIADHGDSTATVSFTGSGGCGIYANQAGNAQYMPALPVHQFMTVAHGPAALVFRRGGSGQSAMVGAAFREPLLARITDKNQASVGGASVTFTVNVGSAHFPGGTSATVTADSEGYATSPVLTAGSSAGRVNVIATSGAASGGFQETVTPAAGTTADLAVALSAPAEVQTGTRLALVVTVTNAGPSASGKVLTSVPIPPGFTVTKTGGGVKNGATVMFSLRDGLAVNASHSYTINLTTTRKLSSKATFHASTAAAVPDPNLADNSASDTIQID